MKYEDIKTPEELLEFMNKNISYGFVSKSGKIYKDSNSNEWEKDWYNECIVQSGIDILKTKVGTCWDQVELERLWFKSNGYQFKTIFIWFELNEINDLPTHAALIYKTNNKYYWFENASEINKEIYGFDSFEEAIESIKQKFLEYVIDNYEVKEEYYNLIKAYIYEEPLAKLSVIEYLKYVTKKLM